MSKLRLRTDRFQLLTELGRGGMGVVYEALDRQTDRRVALKLLTALDDPAQILRFKAEFRALSDLRHPNLVRLGELFEEHGQWFFTMELVEGVDFLRYVRGAPFFPRAELASATLTGLSARVARTMSSMTPTVPRRPAPPLRLHPPEISFTQARTAHGAPLPAAHAHFDEPRLRHAVAELAAGLVALHRAGKVHRDVKPSNILIEESGRTVLLDLSVVAELDAQWQEEGEVVGTMAYMAPEQSLGMQVGPEADWYAVGVLLYRALTRRLPVEGDLLDQAKAKWQSPPSPSALVEGLPPDLVELCQGLLQPNPAKRPDEAQIIEALRVDTEWLEAKSAPISDWGRPFVGRLHELAVMREALLQAEHGRTIALLLEGPSGTGKTVTTYHFLRQARLDQPRLVVLRGRCAERESIPYNAFDGIVDDLTRFLQTRPARKLPRYLPAGFESLLQLFPVLQGVGSAAHCQAPAEDHGTVPRAEAFDTLRALLVKTSWSTPLVLAIDDLHWADADSVALLREVMRPRGGRLLLVATCRPPGGGRAIEALKRCGCELQRIPIGPLPTGEARALASLLLAGQPTRGPDAIERVVSDTGGHPLFIEALARHLARGVTDRTQQGLDDLLWTRIQGLCDPARRLLELLVVAGVPLDHGLAAKAVGLRPAEYTATLSTLQEENLIRSSGARRGDFAEVYHSRVREAVYSRLAEAGRAKLHLELAERLSACGAPAEVLALHFVQGGDATRGAAHALAAAKRAERALAFDQAVRMYRLALEAGRFDDDTRREILATLGEMLINVGRSEEAARTFLEAAAQGKPGAAVRSDLRRRAAEQLLMGGHLAEGLEVTRALLAEVGLSMPRGPIRSVATVVWHRTLLRRRKLSWRQRAESELSEEELLRLDVCWSVAAGLSMVDSIRGAAFSSQLPARSLRLGEPYRICRALSAMCFSESAFVNAKETRRLLDGTRRAAEESGSPMARFYYRFAATIHAFMLRNDWHGCVELAAEARRLWRAAGRGRGWELDTLDQFSCWALQAMGRIAELRRRVTAKLRSARATGNRFAEVGFCTCFPAIHFADDDPDRARQETLEAIGSWLPESKTFGNPNYWALKTLSTIMLYTGDLDRDADEVAGGWRNFGRSMLGRVGILRLEQCQLEGMLAVARAARAKGAGDPRLARAQLRRARSLARRAGRHSLPIGPMVSLMIRAGIARVEDDLQQLPGLLRQVMALYEERKMVTGVAAARRRLGQTLGGDEGEALIDDSNVTFAALGISAPHRYARLLLTGWPSDQ